MVVSYTPSDLTKAWPNIRDFGHLCDQAKYNICLLFKSGSIESARYNKLSLDEDQLMKDISWNKGAQTPNLTEQKYIYLQNKKCIEDGFLLG